MEFSFWNNIKIKYEFLIEKINNRKTLLIKLMKYVAGLDMTINSFMKYLYTRLAYLL